MIKEFLLEVQVIIQNLIKNPFLEAFSDNLRTNI